MISKISLDTPYLQGRVQLDQDYHTVGTRYRYIEVTTGIVCEPISGCRLYCNYTGRVRTTLKHNQYIRVTSDVYRSISGGRHGRLALPQYLHLLGNTADVLRLPSL